MAIPKISLLEKKPLAVYKCEMCGSVTRKNKFLWKSWFTDKEITICRDCAYKEKYGTKSVKKAKKERLLEEESTNQ